MIWKIRDRVLELNQSWIMGVLNLTPDSFSDGGRYPDTQSAAAQAVRMVQEGADILDLGGESTRPNADPVSVQEEIRRVLPVLKSILKEVNVPVSIDTTKPEVALACLQEGAHIINDVSGLKSSGFRMTEAVREFQAGLILMHSRGDSQTMQSLTQYRDVVDDVLDELRESIQLAQEAGVGSDQLVIDPGLGFAKTAEQNMEILGQLEKLHDLKRPVLLGPSRKSFIGKITGASVEEREFGTAAVVTHAVMKKIEIIRVHDVRAMKDVIRMSEALRKVEEGANYVGTF